MDEDPQAKYLLEIASSGRSKCKECDELIEDDAYRVKHYKNAKAKSSQKFIQVYFKVCYSTFYLPKHPECVTKATLENMKKVYMSLESLPGLKDLDHKGEFIGKLINI
jgi:hypothetical protein